jgi:hypothetical protein
MLQLQVNLSDDLAVTALKGDNMPKVTVTVLVQGPVKWEAGFRKHSEVDVIFVDNRGLCRKPVGILL